MARRVKSKKNRKYLGNRSHGAGNTKNRRGKGSRGGVGRAGYHKHKWMKTIKAGENKSRRKGFDNPNATSSITITLLEIQNGINAAKYKAGTDGNYEVALPANCKVLSSGKISTKATVKAGKFSAKAKEKIEKAGGKVIEE